MQTPKLFLISLFALLGLSPAAQIYVDRDATGTNDGSSWTDAFTNLPDAIASATGGEEVWIAEGLYLPVLTDNPLDELEIAVDLELYGGFGGYESALNQRDLTRHPTIVSGNIGNKLSMEDNVEKHLEVTAGVVRLDGLIFEESYITPGVSSGYWGSVWVSGGATLVMVNCTVRHCIGSSRMGVFINSTVTARIENCLFHDIVQNNGDLITSNLGSGGAEIVNCTFANNEWLAGFGSVAGGTSGVAFSVENCIFFGNTGASYDVSGSATIVANSVLELGTFAPESANVTLDPLFCNPMQGDFSLAWNSPAIDIGDNAALTESTDLRQNPRVFGGVVDAGCMELNYRPVFVDHSASGLNDGSSWSDAYTDLQSALAIASAGDQVWVASGTYKPTSTSDRTLAFEIPSNVQLLGGFAGIETCSAERNWRANPTVLSGAIGSTSTPVDNSINVVRVPDGGTTGRLDGFSIRRAYSASGESSLSGAVLINSGDFEIANCIINLNTGDYRSALAVNTADVRVENCLIRDNHSFNTSTIEVMSAPGSLTMVGCTISENSSDGISSYCIGPFINATKVIGNSIFWGNDIPAIGAANVVSDCLVEGGFAGGINILDSDPLFVNPAANDFALQPNSPAVNAANSSWVRESRDLDFNPRMMGGVDMGCLEYLPSDVIFVDTDAFGSKDGTSWQNAFTDLQDALAAFSGSEQIWIAEGTYVPSGGDRAISFVLDEGTELYGGFNASEVRLEDRDPVSHPSVLSGEIGFPWTLLDNSYQIIRLSNGSEAVRLDGLVIEKGYNDETAVTYGGGLHLPVNCPGAIVHQCLFRENSAGYGSAINVGLGVELTISDSEFIGNDAFTYATVRNALGTMDISGCRFENNSAEGATAIESEGDLTLNSCEFVGNSAGNFKGLVSLEGGSFLISDCLFEENIMTGADPLFHLVTTTELNLDRCHFLGNSTGGNSLISEAGMATMKVSNSLFDANASDGGIILASVTDVRNCTFVNNAKTGTPGTGGLVDTDSGHYVENCIFFENSTIPFDITEQGSGSIIRNNIYREAVGTDGNFYLNPNFTDFENGDYTIAVNSPAFEAGDNTGVSTTEDLNGNTRIAGPLVDIGCYEVQECVNNHNLCLDAITLLLDGESRHTSTGCTDDAAEPNPSCMAGSTSTVWWTFTAPAGGTVRVLTSAVTPEAGDLDLHISAFSGDCSSPVEIGCADYNTDNSPETLFLTGLNAGASYLVMTSARPGHSGTYQVAVETADPCFGDLNNDGAISTGDLLAILGEFGCTSSCATDLSGDGEVSTADILTLLPLFGTTCL